MHCITFLYSGYKAIFGERKMLTETNSKIQDFDKNLLALFLIIFDAVLQCCCSLIHCKISTFFFQLT